VDEAGRGCLAGPVVAAAVVLPWGCAIAGLTDSKKLSEKARDALAPEIKARAETWCVGVSWQGEIDATNILRATLAAMGRAVARLRVAPDAVLVDGNQSIPRALVPWPVAQRTVVKGDLRIPAIAAASILAKTFRDHLMHRFARRYPGYGFEKHVGYGTAEHRAALRELGPCPLHRVTFRGVLPEEERGGGQLCLPGL
jgi:ribonuclease HII